MQHYQQIPVECLCVSREYMTVVCENVDMPAASMHGESIANSMRLVALLVAGSLVCSWLNNRWFIKLPVLFFNWASNLMYALSQQIMATMVINCSCNFRGIIYAIKFVELFSVNCIATSSLVIFYNLFMILKNYHKNRRFRAYSQSRAIIIAMTVALVFTAASALYWDMLIITNGYFWVWSENPEHGRWINLSFTIVQSLVGMVMLVLLGVCISFYKSAVKCFKNSSRVRIFTVLSTFAFLCNVYNGISSMLDESGSFTPRTSRMFVMIGWTSRFIQICFDSCVTGWVLNSAELNHRLKLTQDVNLASAEVNDVEVMSPQVSPPRHQEQRMQKPQNMIQDTRKVGCIS
uniref:Uncharacterized protein n=1 Tax=Fibrocapsa japonica TaxID=94617 RepID=A0A7S2US30_9STRA